MQRITDLFVRERAGLRGGLVFIAAAALAACGAPTNGSPASPSTSSPSSVARTITGKGGGGSGGPIPVTTTIADSLNGFPLRVQSDGAGPYTQSSPTQSLVLNGTGGDWEITTYTLARKGELIPGPRKVFFDLTEPVSASNPAPPIQTAFEQAHLITKCNVLTIPVGTTATCPGDFRFDLSTTLAYRLSYSPATFPEDNPFSITCLAADSIGCRQWTVATSGTTRTGSDPNPKGVQQLVQINPVTDAITQALGDYYISFSISFSR